MTRPRLVNTRINNLSSLLPAPPQKSGSSPGEKMSPEDKLKKMITAAEAAFGTRRDSLFSAAAFEAANQGDIDQALWLAVKIDNRLVAMFEINNLT